MNDICSHCGFKFEETTVQAWRRRKDGHGKICRDCQRISRAEAAAFKRGRKVSVKLTPYQELEKKYGTVSRSLLMVKLKVSYSVADQMIKEALHDPKRDAHVCTGSAVL